MPWTIIDCQSAGLESPPVKGSRAKAIWKLKHRYRRLCKRADAARGNCINLTWYAWSNLIFECLNQLEALGVDTETLCEDRCNQKVEN